MKFGVFGNCQAVGMANSIAALVPDAEVHLVTVQEARVANAETISGYISVLSACDKVFYQPSMQHTVSGMQSEDFEQFCRSTISYPLIACRSFHPDCHYLTSETGAQLLGPLGPYHSAIVVGAYLSRLPAQRTVSLFNSFTYRNMGYFDVPFDEEPVGFETRRLGYDFDSFFAGTKGCFMNTINHPRISIIFETARQALERSGIAVDRGAICPADNLGKKAVWPVYPELGAALSVSDPGFRFRHPRRDISLDLDQFIQASYSTYDSAGGKFGSDLADRAAQFVADYVISK